MSNISTDNMLDIPDLIQNFYSTKEYHAIKMLESRKTILDLFKKTRSETIHSAMIAWLFENPEFQSISEPSVISLLRLLANKAKEQTANNQKRSEMMSDTLWTSIITNALSLTVKSVETEEPTSSSKGDGRADIVIYTYCDNLKLKLRICIENKVDSKEHDNQCSKYYEYYRKLNDEYETVYVFLAPTIPSDISEEHFIKISYQDLLDCVIYPIQQYEEKFSKRTSFYLQEYIDAITTIKTKDKDILAMSEEYKKLLQDFFRNNEEIIYAAIEAVGNDEIKQKVSDIRGGTKSYTISFINNNTSIIVNGHTKLAVSILEYLAQQYDSTTILREFGKIVFSGSCQKKYAMSDDKGKTAKNTKIKCTDNIEIYCSNQWIPNKAQALIEKMNNGNYGIRIS